MKVRLLVDWRERMTEKWNDPNLDVGCTYSVLALTFLRTPRERVLAQIENKDGRISHVSLDLLQVVDPMVSPTWRLAVQPQGIELCPEEFLAPYFHDRLSDDEPKAVEAFGKVKKAMALEV